MDPGAATTGSKVATVLRVTSGNFRERFDFFLFGFYASYIAKAFFPAGNEFASLLLTFMEAASGRAAARQERRRQVAG
jgi:MFS transporter, MHS family, citrate/tricarballylate:H+ symporter